MHTTTTTHHPAGRGKFLSSSVLFATVVSGVLLMGLVPSWLGLLGSIHWFLDLMSHFRWQYAAFALVVVLWSLFRKNLRLGAAGVLTAGLNFWLMAGAGPGIGSPEIRTSQATLRVVNFNVLTSNQEHGAVLKFLQSSDADVIVLTEVDSRWKASLKPLLQTHPHHLIKPLSNNFGWALYSRLPFQQAAIIQPDSSNPGPESTSVAGYPTAGISPAGTDALKVHLTHAGRELVLIGLHPVPPMESSNARARDSHLQAVSGLVSRLESSGLPVVVVGDMNASPWSHGFRILTAGNNLRLAPDSWKPTWKTGTIFAIPIDLALCTPPLFFPSRSIGPPMGSDHSPQTIEVGWAD